MKQLPHLIETEYTDAKGIIRSRPFKEIIRELIRCYNQLIEYLREVDGQDEPDNQ